MSQPMDQAVAPPIEGIILANPRPDIPVEQLATLSEAERGLLSAIAGVEHMSFGITPEPDAPYRWYLRILFRDAQALQTSETYPHHTTNGADQWLPIIAKQILIDYHMHYG